MFDKSQIKKSNPGDYIKVDEYNLLKDFVKQFQGDSSSPSNTLANKPLVVFNDSALDYQPYSLFSISGEDSGVTHFAEPKITRFGSTGFNGAPNLFLTNSSTYIPANSKAFAYPIGDNYPVYLQVDPNPGDSPEIGKPCGPVPGTTIISRHYTGFICLSGLSTRNANSGSGAWFTTANSNSAFAGFVSEEITPFDGGTNYLGSGKLKVHFNYAPTFAMKDPADILIDYEIPVKNLTEYTISVGEPAIAHYVAGMGLVVGPPLQTKVNGTCTFISAIDCTSNPWVFSISELTVVNGELTCEIVNTQECIVTGGGGSTSSATSSVSSGPSSSSTPPVGSSSSSSCDLAIDPCNIKCGWICATSQSVAWQSTGLTPVRFEDDIPFGFDKPNLVLEGDGTNKAEATFVHEAVPASDCFFHIRYKHTIDADMISDDFAAADWFTNRLDIDFDERDFDNLDFLTEASVFGEFEIKQNGIAIATIPLPYRTDLAPVGSETIGFLYQDSVAMVKMNDIINIDGNYEIEIKLRGPSERGINLVFDALRMGACPGGVGSLGSSGPSSSGGGGS